MSSSSPEPADCPCYHCGMPCLASTKLLVGCEHLQLHQSCALLHCAAQKQRVLCCSSCNSQLQIQVGVSGNRAFSSWGLVLSGSFFSLYTALCMAYTFPEELPQQLKQPISVVHWLLLGPLYVANLLILLGRAFWSMEERAAIAVRFVDACFYPLALVFGVYSVRRALQQPALHWQYKAELCLGLAIVACRVLLSKDLWGLLWWRPARLALLYRKTELLPAPKEKELNRVDCCVPAACLLCKKDCSGVCCVGCGRGLAHRFCLYSSQPEGSVVSCPQCGLAHIAHYPFDSEYCIKLLYFVSWAAPLAILSLVIRYCRPASEAPEADRVHAPFMGVAALLLLASWWVRLLFSQLHNTQMQLTYNIILYVLAFMQIYLWSLVWVTVQDVQPHRPWQEMSVVDGIYLAVLLLYVPALLGLLKQLCRYTAFMTCCRVQASVLPAAPVPSPKAE